MDFRIFLHGNCTSRFALWIGDMGVDPVNQEGTWGSTTGWYNGYRVINHRNKPMGYGITLSGGGHNGGGPGGYGDQYLQALE